MKKLLHIASIALLSIYSFSAYSLGDIVGGLGLSNHNYTGQPDHEKGFNLNTSLLIPIVEVSPIASLVIGPKLKYESVVGDTTYDYMKKEETFTTMQLGPEAGIKINFIPKFSFYGTVFLTYGISNSLSEKISNGEDYGILDQTVNPSVSNSWQLGIAAKGFYNITSLFGLGAGFEFFHGYYEFDSSSLKVDPSLYEVNSLPVDGGNNSYYGSAFNILVAFYL